MTSCSWCPSPPRPEGKTEVTLLKPQQTDGALEPGGPVDVFAPRNTGLLLHSFAFGFIRFALVASTYGLFTIYLNVEANVAATQKSVVVIPWAFKALPAALNDCFPIAGAV